MTTDEVRRSWDRRAAILFADPADRDAVARAIGVDSWEQFRALAQLDLERAARISGPLGDPQALTILDIGCGVGRATSAFAELFREAHGCDVSPTMIAKARELWGAPPNLHFHTSSGRDLAGFADASFDLVFSNGVFEHMRRTVQRSYLREIGRVLRPGGRFALEFNSPRRVPARLPFMPRAVFNVLLRVGAVALITPLFMRGDAGGAQLLGHLPSLKELRRQCSLVGLEIGSVSGPDDGQFWLEGRRTGAAVQPGQRDSGATR